MGIAGDSLRATNGPGASVNYSTALGTGPLRRTTQSTAINNTTTQSTATQAASGTITRIPAICDEGRPPALSRRDRSEYCFYFDLQAESQHLLASLIRYVIAYGAVLFVCMNQ